MAYCQIYIHHGYGLAVKTAVLTCQAAQRVSVAYEDLVRLSIFVNAARNGEMTSQRDPHHAHFEELFHRLEADQVGGLYTVMCALTTVFRPLVRCRSNIPILGRYRVEAIRSIRVPSTDSVAQRHIRDFTVVRTLQDVALNLIHDARRMAREYQ